MENAILSAIAQRYAVLYAEGRVTDAGLARAVKRLLITQAECDTILAAKAAESET